jgi:hypothetical protein
VLEAGNLTSLSVERDERVTDSDVDAALREAGAGTVVDGHAWLSVSWLRGQGPAGDPQWTAAFEKMIAYAATKGWGDPQRQSVRAHIA